MKPKPPLTYLPLEEYRQRYTELMSCPDGWTERRLGGSFNLKPIRPEETKGAVLIKNGAVLDRTARPLWALEQCKQVLQQVPFGKIYLEDFFHPGIEGLFYSGNDYKYYSYCWAQTFDCFDFTRKEMMPWMRVYEYMALSVNMDVFVASPVLADLILTSVPQFPIEKLHVVGLPFDRTSVARLFDPSYADGEEYDVVYSSRFDDEKQPWLFLELVEWRSDLKFLICTGGEKLKGNAEAVKKAYELEAAGKLTIRHSLEKAEYYALLRKSKVQLNTSRQDWVSFTLLEALTHGCLPLYPMFRDFPGVFNYETDWLYAPSSLSSLTERLNALLTMRQDRPLYESAIQHLRSTVLDFHDGTYHRMSQVILNT